MQSSINSQLPEVAMFNYQAHKPLSFSISELKQQYQNHPSMFEVQLLSLQLKQEKLKARNLYQSLKKRQSVA